MPPNHSLLSEKNAAIRRLLFEAASVHGPDAFPVEDWRLDIPEAVTLTSRTDSRFYASVIAGNDEPFRYSVMIELYDPPEPQFMPFEIDADDNFDLEGVVELLGRYRQWCRP